jgi:hypothetical protein
MLWFLKDFRRKIWRKNGRFWLKQKVILQEKSDHNIGFWEKTPIFSQKIVIITSAPGR